jgi:pilus assembly protein Flp/PilA
MLKYYVKTAEALKRLRADEDGVVSFEYIIVAAAIIVAVGAAFGANGTGPLVDALKAGLVAISGKLTAAVG